MTHLFFAQRSPALCLAFGLAASGGTNTAARAGDAGERDFPATLVVEEPQVETEFVPQIASQKNADNARQTDFGSELSIQLTEPFAVVLHPVFTTLRPGGNGFQNLETTLKYQFIDDPLHEFILSAGLSNEWSGIGAKRVGADPFSTITPTLFSGRGAGDLPVSLDWLRPIAVTAQAGFAIPARTRSLVAGDDSSNPDPNGTSGSQFKPNPYFVSLAGSLQYSLVYAAENVPGLNVPAFMAKLVPLVEYSFQIPVANNGAHAAATGTIDPGFLWCHGDVQIGLEALIPVNRDSGRHPGVRLQLAYSFKTPWIEAAEASPGRKHDGKDRD